MKNFVKLIALFIFVCSFNNAKAVNPDDKTSTGGNTNDSTNNLKSNIVIFKMITNPAPASNNGSLKKADKVARTSSSHSANRINTSIARTLS